VRGNLQSNNSSWENYKRRIDARWRDIPVLSGKRLSQPKKIASNVAFQRDPRNFKMSSELSTKPVEFHGGMTKGVGWLTPKIRMKFPKNLFGAESPCAKNPSGLFCRVLLQPSLRCGDLPPRRLAYRPEQLGRDI
jgi:hypothetical protein